MSDNQNTEPAPGETPSGTSPTPPGATTPIDDLDNLPGPGVDTDGDQDGDQSADGDAEDDGRLRKARKDAAAYRERLRDMEGERDRLTDQLDGIQAALTATRRAQAENILPGVKLDLLERIGLDLTEHLTETGAVDMDAARDAARALAKDAGILPATGARVPSAGHGVESPLRSGNWLSDTLM